MSRERLYLFDTTLRDGAQTNGVDFTLADKQIIAAMLDELGIDYVEGGYPGANPTDTEFFGTRPKLDHARFTAFGMTRRAGRSVSNDPGVAGLWRPRPMRSASWRSLRLPGAGRAGDDEGGEPRFDPRQRGGCESRRPRSHARLRALLRRLQGGSDLRSPARKTAYDVWRALGRAVRHQ